MTVKIANYHSSQSVSSLMSTPQWGAADAEIKDPSGENTELARSPFEVWSRFNI